MDRRELGWGIALAGLPFAHFLCFGLYQAITPWQAQTLWMQAWTLGLWAWSLGIRAPQRLPQNRALAWWVLWTFGSTLWMFMDVYVQRKQYPYGLLGGLGHVLTILWFYLAAMAFWTPAFLARLCRWIAWSGLVVMGYGVLQLVHMDQFYQFKDVINTAREGQKALTSVIGNTTHFGIYLALLLPFFLWHPDRRWKLAAGLDGCLLLLTQSASAVAFGWLVVTWYLWRSVRTVFLGWLVVSLLGSIALLLFRWEALTSWVDLEGRWEAWQAFYQRYWFGDGKRQFTGLGLGAVGVFGREITDGAIFKWGHVHNVWFQLGIEQGVVGVGLFAWVVMAWGKRAFALTPTPLRDLLMALGGVWLAASLFHFPDRLWIQGVFGLFAYCGIYSLHTQRRVTWP